MTASDTYGRGGRASGTLTRPGETVEVTVRMTSVGTVRGRFLMPDHLTPVPFGVVRLLANGRVIGQTTTPGSGDKVGTYSFDYVPVGHLRIEGQDPLTLRTGATSGSIDQDGQEVVIDVVAQGLGAVQGVVRSRRTTGGALEPEAGAHVEVNSEGIARDRHRSQRPLRDGGHPEGSDRHAAERFPEARDGIMGDSTVLTSRPLRTRRADGQGIKAGTTDTPVPSRGEPGGPHSGRSDRRTKRADSSRSSSGGAATLLSTPRSLDEGVPPSPSAGRAKSLPSTAWVVSGWRSTWRANPVAATRARSPGAVASRRRARSAPTGVLAGPVPRVLRRGRDGPATPPLGSTSFHVLPDEAKPASGLRRGVVTGSGSGRRGTPALGADVTFS